MLTYEKLYQEIKNKRKNKRNNIVQKGGGNSTVHTVGINRININSNDNYIFNIYKKYIPGNKYSFLTN